MPATSDSTLQQQRKLIASAYDADAVRRVGHRMVDLLSDHLDLVQNAGGPVLNWREPVENIKLAQQSILEKTDSPQEIDLLLAKFEELIQQTLKRGQNLHHPHYVGHQVPASLPLAGLFDAVDDGYQSSDGNLRDGALGHRSRTSRRRALGANTRFPGRRIHGTGDVWRFTGQFDGTADCSKRLAQPELGARTPNDRPHLRSWSFTPRHITALRVRLGFWDWELIRSCTCRSTVRDEWTSRNSKEL